MWVDAGDGQYKQDDDGKCWSTNEAGSSNGLHLCWEFSGFTEEQAPWNKSESVSCWYHDESTQEYCENDNECYDFNGAIEKYFGGEWEDWETEPVSPIEGTKQWGASMGWCDSDLDHEIGFADDVEACWRMCEAEYGQEVHAVDFVIDQGECYC
jgi:hypothetical protein